jgi:hypothetical protein
MPTKSYLNKPLKPVITKEIDKFAQNFKYTDANGVTHHASPELLKELENRLRLEQVRCETMTKDSIGGDRRKRAAITFVGTAAAGVIICLVTASPIGLVVFAAPAAQAAISVATIRLSRDKRLKGAGNSVCEMVNYEVLNGKIGLDGKPIKKHLTEAEKNSAVEETKKNVSQALKENPEILLEHPELKALLQASTAKSKALKAKEINKNGDENRFFDVLRQNPELAAQIKASKIEKTAEGALPIPAFYGIRGGQQLQANVAVA